jgi:hypothetical protein
MNFNVMCVTKLIWFLLLGWVSVSACAGLLDFGGTSWKEEVYLHDGSTIIVERSVVRGGQHEIGQEPPIKEQTLIFRMPGTNEEVAWEDKFTEDVGGANFLPMLLEIEKETAFLVVHPMGSLAYSKWGLPNPPYVVFRYQNKKWKRITLQELPAEFGTPNLIFSSPDSEAKKARQLIVSAERIKHLYDGYKQLEYKTIVRAQLDHWRSRPAGSNSGKMVRTGDGGWIGMDWFENQPSLDACLTKCTREKVSTLDCPCRTLFKDE